MIDQKSQKFLVNLIKNAGDDCKDINLELFEQKYFDVGEIITTLDKIPQKISLLVSGELRLRGFIEETKNPFTLDLVKSPYLIGISSIRCGKPTEFITASSKVILLSIDYQDWLEFLDDKPRLSKNLNEQITVADLWFTLSKGESKLNLPSDSKNMRKYLNSLRSTAKLIDLNATEIGLLKFSDNEFNWLLVNDYLELNSGSILDSDQVQYIQKDIDQSIYIIGLPSFHWQDKKSILVEKQTRDNVVIPSLDIDANETNESDIQKNQIDNIKEDNPNKLRFFSSASGFVNQAAACFQMLGSYFNLPIRYDVIFKVLQEQSERTNGIVTLQLCAALGESLGLQTQLAEVPFELANRIETPTFVEFKNNEIAILFEINNNQFRVGRPLHSIENFNNDELKNLISDENKLPVLLFRKTERTPEKKLTLSWFKPSIIKNRKPLTQVLIASILVQLFQLMNPLIVQQIIDKVIGQNGVNTLPVLATLLLGFAFFENVLTALRTNLFIDTTNRIDISLGEQIIDHLLRLPLNYFDKRSVGELSSRLGEMEQIRSFLTGTALTVLLDAIFSIIYIGIMLIYSWILTIVALILVPILGLITFGVSPVLRKQIRAKAECNAKTQNHLVEVLTGIQTVKAQNFEINARWKWKERYSKYISEGFRNAVTSSSSNSITKLLNQISSLSVLCVGSYLVIRGQLTLGQLIAFRIISGYVTTPLLRLSNLYQSFQQTAISLERLSDILNNPQESTIQDRSNIPMKTISGSVRIEDVSFGFKDKGPLQVTNVSLEVSQGEFVGIVGQSGSGKSTLMKLIPRLYDTLAGTIFVDDYDISKVELYSLRRQIGIVPQDSLLFDGTVQDNISLTNPDATSDEIIAAAKVAFAHDFIMKLPLGYNTPVGERGGGLSGGQRQRIAIARTVLQNPRMLIMDEATSALDYESERRVSVNLMEYFRSRTVFFITHRLPSIRHADKIIVMHDGKIDEVGTHDNLMSLKGRYYALYLQQEASSEIAT